MPSSSPTTKRPTASKPTWTAFARSSPTAASPTASCFSTPKFPPHSRATELPPSSPAPRSILRAPMVSRWFPCVLTSPAFFAVIVNTTICYPPATFRKSGPLNPFENVLTKTRPQDDHSQETCKNLHAPNFPLRASHGHHWTLSFPHRQSRCARTSRRTRQRPHRRDRSLSSRRSRRSSFPRTHASHQIHVSRSRPRLRFFQLWRALHAQRRQRAAPNRRRHLNSRPRAARRHRNHATPSQDQRTPRSHSWSGPPRP